MPTSFASPAPDFKRNRFAFRGAAVTGTGYKTGYQFHGTENDTWAYYAGSSYYSPNMGRALTVEGPLTAAGSYGDPGLAGVVSAAMPTSGSASSLGPINLNVAANLGIGAAAGGLGALGAVVLPNLLDIGFSIPGVDVAAAIATFVDQLLNLLGVDLFGGGGSPSLPPMIQYELNHRGGNEAVVGGIFGQYPEWATSQRPVLQFVGYRILFCDFRAWVPPPNSI